MSVHRESNFRDPRIGSWIVTEIGAGEVGRDSGGALRLRVRGGHAGYSNAQIADYDYGSFNFVWTPPLRLTVTAFATGDPRGTAGFGFWNHPFSPDARSLPRLPRAIWFFFGSPPNDMRLAYGQPGSGWKAATIDATRRSALALIPFAPFAVLLMRAPPLYARLWPALQRRLHIAERVLDPALLTEVHTYTIDWRDNEATFAVDGSVVLEAPHAPRQRCGFVAWIDNQYAVVTPAGRIGFGITPVAQDQALVLEHIAIERA